MQSGSKNQFKAAYRFNTIPFETPMVLFTETFKKILKFVWKYKRPGKNKTVLKKQNKAEGIMLPHCKLYYKL